MKVKYLITVPLSLCAKLHDKINSKDEHTTPLKEAYVARRLDNGKYFRGQKIWQWANSPRHACFLPKDFYTTFYKWQWEEKGIEVELIKAEDISL